MNKKSPEEIRQTFKLVRGGLSDSPDSGFRPEDFEESELRESPVGKILQRYFEKLADESEGFRIPVQEELDATTKGELDFMSSDTAEDTFYFKSGPFLIDP